MFNITGSRVVSEVRADLPDIVGEAKRTSPPEEFPLIELAGQCIHFALLDIEDDNLVELSAFGSETPSAGARVFNVSVTTRRIKAKAEVKPAPVPWTPDQGPLGPVRATPALPASDAAVGA